MTEQPEQTYPLPPERDDGQDAPDDAPRIGPRDHDIWSSESGDD